MKNIAGLEFASKEGMVLIEVVDHSRGPVSVYLSKEGFLVTCHQSYPRLNITNVDTKKFSVLSEKEKKQFIDTVFLCHNEKVGHLNMQIKKCISNMNPKDYSWDESTRVWKEKEKHDKLLERLLSRDFYLEL